MIDPDLESLLREIQRQVDRNYDEIKSRAFWAWLHMTIYFVALMILINLASCR